MLYFLAWICPPLALLMCGKPFSAIINLVLLLTFVFAPVSVVWAVLVVNDHNADKRFERFERASRRR